MSTRVYVQITYSRQEDEPPEYKILENLYYNGEYITSKYLNISDPNEEWDGDLDGHNDGYDYAISSVGAMYYNRPSDAGSDAPGFDDLNWQPNKYVLKYFDDSTIDYINQNHPELIKDVSDDKYDLASGWSSGPGFSVSVDTSFLTAGGITSAIVDDFTSALGNVAQNVADSLGVGALVQQALRAKDLYEVISNYNERGLGLIKYGLDNFDTLDPVTFNQMADDYFRLGQQTFLSELEKQLGTSGMASQVLKNISIISEAGTNGTIEVIYTPSINLTASIDDGLVVTAGVGVSFIAGGGGDEIFVGGQAPIEIAAGGGNDYLYGGAGADTMGGGSGDDKLFSGNGNDTLYGGGGNDSLIGGFGNDAMLGGTGNDIYVVSQSGDIVREFVNQGTDLVKASITYSLVDTDGAGTNGGNIDKLTLVGTRAINGTGNALANTLSGNAAANILNGLAGNDILIGGAGNDSLNGGLGSDTFVFNVKVGTSSESARVVVTGTANDIGQDKVAGINLSGGDTIKIVGTNVSQFTHGTDTAIGTATGTSHTGVRGDFTKQTGLIELNQTTNNNWTDKGDVAITFVNPSETLTEAGFEMRLKYALTGTIGNNTLVGGKLADVLSGNAGADTLNGGLGNDTLTGGAGQDVFKFTTATGSSNVDKIADFKVADDTIQLENSTFTKFGTSTTGTINSAFFRANTTGLAQDSNDYIVYETDTGKLFYDSNGSAAGGSVQIALLGANLALTSADYVLV